MQQEIGQAVLELELAQLGGPLDHLAHALGRHRSHREALEAQAAQRRRSLEGTEVVGTHGNQGEQRRALRVERLAQSPQEGVGWMVRVLRVVAQELLELVDHQEDVASRRAVQEEQLPRELGQRAAAPGRRTGGRAPGDGSRAQELLETLHRTGDLGVGVGQLALQQTERLQHPLASRIGGAVVRPRLAGTGGRLRRHVGEPAEHSVPRSRLPGPVERLGQGPRERARRLSARQERADHEPAVVAAQLRHEPRAGQRGLAAARGAQDRHQARIALALGAAEQLETLAHLVSAAEEDRRVRLVEGAEARIRRIVGSPFAVLLGRDPLDLEAVEEPPVALLRVGAQIDELLLGEDRGHLRPLAPGVDLEHEQLLALHPRERDLGEAPLRGQVGVGAERDHRAAGAQLGVERSLPAHPGLDALLRVEVEEDRAMSLLLELGLES